MSLDRDKSAIRRRATIAPLVEETNATARKNDSSLTRPVQSYIYRAYLTLHLSINDTSYRTLCWLQSDGSLTWHTSEGTIATIVCIAASLDESDFLGERFFVETIKGERWTCYTKSKTERDAWMHALQAAFASANDDTSLASHLAEEVDFHACYEAAHVQLEAWTNMVEQLSQTPYGIWKETRHWRLFRSAERQPVLKLQKKMLMTTEVDTFSLVLGLYVYVKNPMMIVTLLAQLSVHADVHIVDVELYWPQILHWGIIYWSGCQSVNMQLFYLHFLSGVCRRSTQLAIKTAWECEAARVDAAKAKDNSRFAAIVLIQVYACQLSLSAVATAKMAETCYGPQLTRAHHQQLQSLFNASQVLLGSSQSGLFGEWLAATTSAEIDRVQSRMRAEYSSGAFYLDPLPTSTPSSSSSTVSSAASLRGQMITEDDADEMEALLREFAMADSVPEVEDPLVVFEDTMHLVHSLVVASQNFKRLIDDPRDRKKHLPVVLARLRETMPAKAVLPLDTPVRVVDVLLDEGTVFSTKARAPTMVWFEAVSLPPMMTLRPAPLNPVVYFADRLLQDVLDVAVSSSSGSSREPTMVETHLSLLDASFDDVANVSTPRHVESFLDKKDRIRAARSRNKELVAGWDVVPVIAKSFDDMRQEVFVMQLMHLFDGIFQQEGMGSGDQLWLRPYSIMCCGEDCGLMEVLIDSMSISDAKKHFLSSTGGPTATLMDIFTKRYGPPDSAHFQVARKNFIRSMAAYSLFCYVLQIKDRHNGNLMLHADGYVMHIDFGFCFGTAPGGSFSIERAPFKLTDEMIQVMGPAGMTAFQGLLADGLVALHRHATRLLALVRVTSLESPFPCFAGDTGYDACRRMKDRLCVDATDEEWIRQHAITLVARSAGSVRTKLYVKLIDCSSSCLG
ncbi:unnamed protein product [Aphanomyces euteiches]